MKIVFENSNQYNRQQNQKPRKIKAYIDHNHQSHLTRLKPPPTTNPLIFSNTTQHMFQTLELKKKLFPH